MENSQVIQSEDSQAIENAGNSHFQFRCKHRVLIRILQDRKNTALQHLDNIQRIHILLRLDWNNRTFSRIYAQNLVKI